MPRYIDADKLKEGISHITVTVMGGRSYGKTIFGRALNSYREEVLKRIEEAPEAYVVPKSEAALPPCKIGDTAYAIKTNYHSKRVHSGKVSEMYYVGEEMKLCIVVKSVGRGQWGKDVFGTYEEAERSLQNERRTSKDN